jgi:hypothetical protein
MVRSNEWRQMLSRYRWLDRYLAGEPFERFSAAEELRVRDILRELGTAEDSAQSLRPIGSYPLFVLGGLVLFGVAAMSRIGWKKAAADRFRGTGTSSLVDGSQPTSASPPVVRERWRAVALIGAGVILNLLLVERAGFLVASAVLFWLVARAFDDRHPVRDAAFAVGVAGGAYLLFAQVLQISLPGGFLADWL